MAQQKRAPAGYWKGDRMEIALRYTYRPEFVPLFMDYLGARPDMSILDVGCGSGFVTRLIARTCEGSRVIGLDSETDTLALAEQMADRDGLSDQISFISGDVTSLPFSNNSFDMVTSHRLL